MAHSSQLRLGAPTPTPAPPVLPSTSLVSATAALDAYLAQHVPSAVGPWPRQAVAEPRVATVNTAPLKKAQAARAQAARMKLRALDARDMAPDPETSVSSPAAVAAAAAAAAAAVEAVTQQGTDISASEAAAQVAAAVAAVANDGSWQPPPTAATNARPWMRRWRAPEYTAPPTPSADAAPSPPPHSQPPPPPKQPPPPPPTTTTSAGPRGAHLHEGWEYRLAMRLRDLNVDDFGPPQQASTMATRRRRRVRARQREREAATLLERDGRAASGWMTDVSDTEAETQRTRKGGRSSRRSRDADGKEVHSAKPSTAATRARDAAARIDELLAAAPRLTAAMYEAPRWALAGAAELASAPPYADADDGAHIMLPVAPRPPLAPVSSSWLAARQQARNSPPVSTKTANANARLTDNSSSVDIVGAAAMRCRYPELMASSLSSWDSSKSATTTPAPAGTPTHM